jgi:hypothetical protein
VTSESLILEHRLQRNYIIFWKCEIQWSTYDNATYRHELSKLFRQKVGNRMRILTYEGVSKIFRAESVTKYTPITINTREGKPTRLTHKIAIQLHLVAESFTMCSSRYRRPVRKLLDTPSYVPVNLLLSPELKRPKREADHSPSSSAKVKNNTSSWRGA